MEGWAPLVIMSGGLGNFTKNIWKDTEADQFAAIAIQRGVPAADILIENRSTNTGENILFTQRLLEQKGLKPAKLYSCAKALYGKKIVCYV